MNLQVTAHRVCAADAAGAVTGARDTYLVSEVGGADDGEVLKAVLAQAAEFYGDALLAGASITADPGGGVREVEVRYESSSTSFSGDSLTRVKRPGDRIWSFDTTGDWVRIKRGLSLVQRVPAAAVNPGTRIGWDGSGDGETAGVECLLCRMREKCVATFRAKEIDISFKRTLMRLTGRVNASSFHGWEAGEVLFLGASQGAAYRNSSGKWLVDVTYRFAIALNEYSPSLGDFSFAGRVEGWDYRWALWGRNVSSGTPGNRMRGIYLTRLYRRADFGPLKLHAASNEEEIRKRLLRAGTSL